MQVAYQLLLSLSALKATFFTKKKRTMLRLLKFCNDNFWYYEKNENYTRSLKKVDKESLSIMTGFFMSDFTAVTCYMIITLIGNAFSIIKKISR